MLQHLSDARGSDDATLASKIWFITNEDAICYHRADSAPDQPQLDTYGGEVEPQTTGHTPHAPAAD